MARGIPITLTDGYVPTDLLEVSKGLSDAKLGNCTGLNATIPVDQTTPNLPPPSKGLTLKHITLGRGTQNYSCLCNQTSATPKAVGALATLFDASCLAQNYPTLLNELPNALSNVSVDTLAFLAITTGRLASPDTGSLILGKHYFDSAGVPSFDLRLGGTGDWMKTKVIAKADSPIKGKSLSDGSGYNVKWLKLTSVGGEGIKVSAVPPSRYRLVV